MKRLKQKKIVQKNMLPFKFTADFSQIVFFLFCYSVRRYYDGLPSHSSDELRNLQQRKSTLCEILNYQAPVIRAKRSIVEIA